MNPGNDFYRYVNEDWISKAKIPTGMPRINSFVDLYLNTEKQTQSIIDELQKIPENSLSHNQRNIRNLYLSYLNEEAIEKSGLQGFDWGAFISSRKLTDKQLEKVIVETDSAVEQTAKIFADTPISTLKDYLTFQYISEHARYLNKTVADAQFDFYSKKLNGVEKQRTRQERALQTVNSLQGEPLGQIYVEKYFDPQSKEKIKDLVSYVRGTFNERLKDNDWMDDTTRQEALKKLEQFTVTVKVGYPDQWNDFSTINLNPNTLLENYKQVLAWSYDDMISKIGQPVRKWEWGMTPQTVNAYFNPVQNEIVFPAAILQAPFFDPNVDPAYNYGAIGAVIGHEMGHGFDDQGSLYDGTGQLRNWWSDSAKEHFKQKLRSLLNNIMVLLLTI
nr:M13 family metallopeptidase [Providencia sp. G1(2023)]